MRVVVNAANLRGHGSARIGHHVLAELSSQPEIEGEAWVPASWDRKMLPESARWNIRRCRAGPAAKLWRELTTVRNAARANVLFSMGDTPVPRTPRQLLLVQQAHLAYEPCDWGYVPSLRFATKMRLMAEYFRAGFRGVARFTVQTEDMRRRLASRWDIEPGRIEVVPSSIDIDEILGVGSRPPTADAPYLCYVAAPAGHKNHRILAEVLAALPRDRARVRLKLTATPRDVPELVDRAKQLGVFQRLDWLGNTGRRSALRVVRDATATVMPSVLESFGLGYYEAMALGVPVIAADRDFAREACANAALYASPHSGDDLADKLERILSDQNLASAMATEGRKRVEETVVSWQSVAERYLAILRSLGEASG